MKLLVPFDKFQGGINLIVNKICMCSCLNDKRMELVHLLFLRRNCYVTLHTYKSEIIWASNDVSLKITFFY